MTQSHPPVQQAKTQSQTYRVVLRGIRADVASVDAKAGLAMLFKASTEQIDKLLSVGDYTIKKALPLDVATKYKEAINKAGGVSDLIAEGASAAQLDVDLPSADVPKKAQQPVSEEVILFQGDASLVKSLLRIVQGTAIGTTSKFTFSGGAGNSIVLRPEDVLSVNEEKHGFGQKWVVKAKAGQTHQFIAANMPALRQSMLALSGQYSAEAAPAEPDVSAVKNRTAWVAAFGPTLSGVILALVGGVLGWNFENATFITVLQILIFRLGIMYTLLKIDHAALQHRGFNTVKLGIAPPEQGPLYLFSRAKAFGHSNAYAFTWCVLFCIEVLYALN